MNRQREVDLLSLLRHSGLYYDNDRERLCNSAEGSKANSLKMIMEMSHGERTTTNCCRLFSRKSKAVHGAELSNPDWNGIIEAVTLAANKNNDSTSTNGAKKRS